MRWEAGRSKINIDVVHALFGKVERKDDKRSGVVEPGAALARHVAAEYGTADVFELAARAGVRLVYERWPLLTVGECEPRAGIVRVNLAALEQAREGDERFTKQALARLIIAHELGHFFDARLNRTKRQGRTGRQMAEKIAHAFAVELLRLPSRAFEEYERFWRGL
jgi:hypothetical protein